MLKCDGLQKKYLNKVAIDDVTTEIVPGKIYALLGPNGSGKSTFMKIVAGLIKPTAGLITFDEMLIGVESKKHIAYMSTEPYFFSYMTCETAGNYYRDFFEDFDVDKYYRLLDKMELSPKQKLSKMSSGMMAKAKVAITLARNSNIIMLDEPLNGIDLIARDVIIQTIVESASPERAIIVSSHLVDEMEESIDAAIFLRDGRIVMQGDIEDLKAQNNLSLVDMYKQVYGRAQKVQEVQ